MPPPGAARSQPSGGDRVGGGAGCGAGGGRGGRRPGARAARCCGETELRTELEGLWRCGGPWLPCRRAASRASSCPPRRASLRAHCPATPRTSRGGAAWPLPGHSGPQRPPLAHTSCPNHPASPPTLSSPPLPSPPSSPLPSRRGAGGGVAGPGFVWLGPGSSHSESAGGAGPRPLSSRSVPLLAPGAAASRRDARHGYLQGPALGRLPHQFPVGSAGFPASFHLFLLVCRAGLRQGNAKPQGRKDAAGAERECHGPGAPGSPGAPAEAAGGAPAAAARAA